MFSIIVAVLYAIRINSNSVQCLPKFCHATPSHENAVPSKYFEAQLMKHSSKNGLKPYLWKLLHCVSGISFICNIYSKKYQGRYGLFFGAQTSFHIFRLSFGKTRPVVTGAFGATAPVIFSGPTKLCWTFPTTNAQHELFTASLNSLQSLQPVAHSVRKRSGGIRLKSCM